MEVILIFSLGEGSGKKDLTMVMELDMVLDTSKVFMRDQSVSANSLILNSNQE